MSVVHLDNGHGQAWCGAAGKVAPLAGAGTAACDGCLDIRREHLVMNARTGAGETTDRYVGEGGAYVTARPLTDEEADALRSRLELIEAIEQRRQPDGSVRIENRSTELRAARARERAAR